MHEQLPIFPLGIVVFPTESLNLHIFEPRYKQLIKECEETGMTFGIPTYLDGKIKEVGTEVQLKEIVNTYPDGRIDIRSEGIRTFKLSNIQHPISGKLYSGGNADYIEPVDDSIVTERILLVEKASRLFDLMEVDVSFPIESKFLSFKIAHKIGLSLPQEYHLLTIHSESDRINFILDHLSRAIPIVQEMEKSKEKIKMNGHFKHFDPLNF